MAFASVYPHYIAKAVKKDRTKEEVHTVIRWLTGYDEKALQRQIDEKVDFETGEGVSDDLAVPRNLCCSAQGHTIRQG